MTMAATLDGAMTVSSSDRRPLAIRPVACRLVSGEVVVDGRIRREVDAREQRFVARPVVEIGGRDARCAVRSAVESAPEGDDPRSTGDPAGEFERPVDDFGARVEEHDRIDRVGQGGHQFVRQARRRFGVADHRDRSDQSVDLGVDRGRHAWMGVTQRGHRDPVGEVEIGLAVRVVQVVSAAVAPFALEVAAEDRGQVAGRCP